MSRKLPPEEKAKRVAGLKARSSEREIRLRSYDEKPRRRLPGLCNESRYTDEEREFLKAVDRFRREKHRPFPTFVEILEVAKKLGYRKVAEPDPDAPVIRLVADESV